MPFGADVGIIALSILLVFFLYMGESKNRFFYLMAVGPTVYMFTAVQSDIGLVTFAGLAVFCLFRTFIGRA